MRYLLILLTLIILTSCQGPTGPTGKNGKDGVANKKIYSGYADSDSFFVAVPEIDLVDFPVVGCYYKLNGSYTEMNTIYSDSTYIYYPHALIRNGSVLLREIHGLDFKIIVVY